MNEPIVPLEPIKGRALLEALGKKPMQVPDLVVNTSVVSGTVQLGKPWYLSKKLWLGVIGLALVLYQTITGKQPETLPEVLDHVAKIASILGVIVPLILAIAHVDAHERKLILEVLGAAADLAKPELTQNEVAKAALVPSNPWPKPEANLAEFDPLSGRKT